MRITIDRQNVIMAKNFNVQNYQILLSEYPFFYDLIGFMKKLAGKTLIISCKILYKMCLAIPFRMISGLFSPHFVSGMLHFLTFF